MVLLREATEGKTMNTELLRERQELEAARQMCGNRCALTVSETRSACRLSPWRELEGTTRKGWKAGDQLKVCLHCPESGACLGKDKGKEERGWGVPSKEAALRVPTGQRIILPRPLLGKGAPQRTLSS